MGKIGAEGTPDEGKQHHHERHKSQPPDPEHQRQPEQGGAEADDQADGRVVWNHYVLIGVRFRIGTTCGLGLGKVVTRCHLRNHREIIGWRRRGDRPFERPPVPRVSQRHREPVALADADPELDRQTGECRQDQSGPKQRQPHEGLERRVAEGDGSAGHALQTEPVKRQKGKGEPRNPEQRRGTAPAFVQAEPEGLWEPVVIAREQPKEHARDEDVVEMRHEEQGVVHLKADNRVGQHHAGQTADHEEVEEPGRVDHRHRHADAPSEQCRHPVIDLDASGHGDGHRGDAEGDVDIGALPHGEEVMQPDAEA